tara:strand:+ start:42 stop:971 length:930 start_codon:yes stop_codon:yes gene_type:complete
MKTLKLISILIFIIFFNTKANSIENKIVLKIDNEIITSLDIKKEARYLVTLNPNTKNLSKDQIYLISKNSLIREKIKKKEILKNSEFINIEKDILDQLIKNMFEKININSRSEFINYLNKNKLTIDHVEEKIKMEVMWNRLVYLKFKSKIKINSKEIKAEILKNQKTGSKKYFLQEILFDIKKDENIQKKNNLIKDSIKKQGFEKTALLYSISSTSQNNGNIGWISANSLNKNIYNKIKDLKTGEISKPITIPGGFLILKVLEMKIDQEELDVEKQFSKIVKNKTNSQLNQYSLIFYNKIKKDIQIDEL